MDGRFNTLLIATALLFVVTNTVFLDIVVFGKASDTAPAVPISVEAPSACPAACTPVMAGLITAKLTDHPAAAVTPSVAPVQADTSPKEYYVPLGSGTTKNDQWEAIPGAEATIDTSLYPKIKQVTFESYLRIPVGIGWMHVKLFNATDGHDVWGSQLQTESNTSSHQSAVITLDPGNKRYIVMAQSTIRAEAYIDNARIKIITY